MWSLDADYDGYSQDLMDAYVCSNAERGRGVFQFARKRMLRLLQRHHSGDPAKNLTELFSHRYWQNG